MSGFSLPSLSRAPLDGLSGRRPANVDLPPASILRKENLGRKAIVQGVNPVEAYLQYGKF